MLAVLYEKDQQGKELGQMWYENGLRLVMELALSTKVPDEWTARKKEHRYL